MTSRAIHLTEPIVDVLSSWPGVDSIAIIHSGSDTYDPYYFVSLDVYCSGDVPEAGARQDALKDHTMFESSQLTRKDRFLVGETPVRIEYKLTRRFNELVEAARAGESRFRDAGTYPFYRLATADVVFSRTDWLADIRAKLENLPDAFWVSLRDTQRARAEHTYADLSAAAVRDDQLFFVVSAGRFLRSLAGLLFTINKRFQPSYRLLAEELYGLPILPESFAARMESFIRQDGTWTLGQRRELAELMVTSVLSL
jgi:hypothetical protein